MFDRSEEIFERKPPVMRVAVMIKPERRRIPGVWHLLMGRLASLRGVGAGSPNPGMNGAHMEATVWYDEPEVITALFEALKAEPDVESFKVLGHS